MRLLRSLCMALSMYMYSGIPVPQVKWEKENMAYAMCFFPVVGLIQGACVLLVFFLCDRLGFSAVLSGALLTLVPLAEKKIYLLLISTRANVTAKIAETQI